jgi:hypothetical protein
MVYWDRTSGTGGVSPIFKWCRSGSNNNGGLYHGFPQFYQTVRPQSSGIVDGGDWAYKDDASVVAEPQDEFNGVALPGPTWRQWNFIEHDYALNNPASSSNGACEMRNNAANMFPTPVVNQSGGGALTYGKTRTSSSTATIDWIILFFDGLSTPGANAYTMNVDELYVDITRQRVVLTDNTTFASSTKFLMQPPTAWGDTQIVATLNRPTFSGGATGYFHVFNGAEVVVYSATLP